MQALNKGHIARSPPPLLSSQPTGLREKVTGCEIERHKYQSVASANLLAQTEKATLKLCILSSGKTHGTVQPHGVIWPRRWSMLSVSNLALSKSATISQVVIKALCTTASRALEL